MYCADGGTGDLHSFPTRRSSDLTIEDGALLRGRVEAGKQPNKAAEVKASAATASGSTSATASATGKAAETASLSPDRKSTRLNSSHRCISYAVFCLKKKIFNIYD